MKRHALGIALTILGLAACISTAYAVDNKGYMPVTQTPDMITVYINGMEQLDGKLLLQADPIEWYEGEAADAAFVKEEPDAGLDYAPDGYYIVNDDETAETLEVDPNAAVLMQIYDRGGSLVNEEAEWNQAFSLAKFESIYHADSQIDISEFPYHLTLKNGKVVRIVQQFIP
ncbi:hypothetical protein [Paenibacillus montanisoli]|uniref:Uncharacterized protein n=1 Tax=Paenibacillus montanisoli TaxID=2081970 RepID=A0A328TWR3_9BACL|nr:hypothetical protein [Paenibacillus montanisoli]RAP74927.1 hypothetical protein DL346_16125 [Paenibacillus montanisoli]